MSAFHPTATTFRQGSFTLPRDAYTSEDVLRLERERLFAKTWNCVGRSSSIARAGDYIVRDVGGDSIIILRDRNNQLRAFFNTCRHRGTQLCSAESGHVSETIQCPYHAWTYTTDGRLIGAPHMQGVEGFDKNDFGLHAAAVAEWEGFLFVNTAEAPKPFADEWAPMIGRLERFDLSDLVVGHRVVYTVGANWKLVFQNYSECLHCPTIHPELNAVLPYQSGANDLVEGPFLGGYMEITEPNQSATMSGRACGRIISDKLDAANSRRAYYYTLMPNLMLSIHPDYVNYYLVRPVDALTTVVESEWLFHPATLAGSESNIQDAVEFWDVTNRQDWDIVERSQRGIASSRYQPGPYSPRESIPAAWDRAYLELMK